MELKIQNLHDQAVDAALQHSWEKAIALNRTILDLSPQSIDAFLALGFAYLQLGNLKDAKEYYRLALRIDPSNIIAKNNIEKINILSKKGERIEKPGKRSVLLSPDLFMTVKGKTRTVTLINLGQADVLAQLQVGEIVLLQVRKRRLEVRNHMSEYIGCLPDDISKRLIFFLEAKSEYETIIKEATKHSVEVFIKERKKGAKVRNFISFPDNIQDDMKRIIGKTEDDEENVERIDLADEDDFEDNIDDLDRLASEVEDHDNDGDETFLSELEEEDEDDET
ncbi:hypothetical protein A3B02_01815 [Candidatus Roizmanbacteria bacterium RIFCSPLOWO2_01_FULL_42_14]|uniref:Uncharacterized protein n=4 Tax=Candidatus Roizmaniibacteriota TaxID=1752723 RepID=A0A1F7JT84_9BACT|nr:MAG: hypothetical protein A3D08_03465 [Candidatus Roizmanbacteria bacterium RIFCSPHIGHO2_02_FULL_43_11]OGK38563.1 MAG: hypothetical protein A3F32_00360 [Candidatus Roizmanbacteria bacterium RIFCSPHIGHO2_12_FULL_42_10]OGK51703.1 MAG: hypothetical protein A3B02_01815 [Candidatus Roizmanbacteria bacterium RIFCSPLOWO2_01_FULL_42_14]OGK58811.1 MAG: hypothetical protein A3I56_03560 [Candidatus Roizmanbacteria bacterium RIFCSPLOWO2_02_FULL_43_10]